MRAVCVHGNRGRQATVLWEGRNSNLACVTRRCAVPGMGDEQCEGQREFYELCRTDPGIAELVRSTACDPFFDDARLPAFRTRVAELRVLLRRAGR